MLRGVSTPSPRAPLRRREIADQMARENVPSALRAGLLVEAHRQAQHRKAAALNR
jgi:hypothetical protein